MATTVETYRGTVYPWELDHMEHMNVRFYTAKFDEATFHLFAMIGLTPSYLRHENRGMAAVQQNITYRRELLAGDIVVIESRILEIGDRKLRFVHVMRNAETMEEAATSELLGVHIDRTARKSCPFPQAVLAAGRSMIGNAA